MNWCLLLEQEQPWVEDWFQQEYVVAAVGKARDLPHRFPHF